MRNKRWLGALLGFVTLGHLGCQTLLGDFSLAGTGTNGDAGDSDGAANPDGAGADTGTPLPPLACDWANPTPNELMNLSTANAGGRLFEDGRNIFVGRGDSSIAQDTLRVLLNIVQTGGGTTGGGSRPALITYRTGGTAQPAQWVYLGANSVFDMFKLKSGDLGILTGNPDGNPGTQTVRLDLLLVPGTLPGGQAPSLSVPIAGGKVIANNSVNAAAIQLGNADFFYTASYQRPDSQYAIAIGRGTEGPHEILTSANRNDVDSPRIVPAGADNYIGTAGDPTQGAGKVYKVAADAKGPPTTLPPLNDGSSNAFVLAAGAANGGGAANLTIGELNMTATTGVLKIRIGQLPFAKLATLQSADIQVVKSYDKVDEVPMNRGQFRWWQNSHVGGMDDFTAIGLSPTPNTPGLNFIWVDARGDVRSDRSATAAGPHQRLLTDRPNILAAAVGLAGGVVTTFYTWDIAWVERKTDLAGAFHVLYHNQLVCH